MDPKTGRRIVMALPAYDQCIKASHVFNLLDARGVISVTERQAYIGRVRALAKQCADAFVQTEAGGWAPEGLRRKRAPRERYRDPRRWPGGHSCVFWTGHMTCQARSLEFSSCSQR